jgi:hypothetical protein
MKLLNLWCVFLVVLFATALGAQSHPDRPVVTMSITPPGEQAQQLTALESGLARLKVKDGTEYGFRPTIVDSSPWNRVIVTIFRMDPQVAILGDVGLKTGGPAVESKTKPVFRVAATKVSPGA